MRVLVLTNGWPTARHPEYAVFNERQVASLRALGVEVDVDFVNARERGKLEYLRRLPTVARRARPFDLVHCFHGLSFVLARLGLVRRPLVVSFQNALDREFAEMPRPLAAAAEALAARLLRRGDAGVIFKGAAPDWLRDDPLVRRIPNGVDMAAFRPGDRHAARTALGLEPDAIHLLFVSSKRLDRPQKRHDRFVAAAAALRERLPGRAVRELTLVDDPPERVRLTYQAADAHVMTSDFEGSPNSVKEAMASGLPVVSTAVGNVPDMLGGLEAARVLDAFTPAACAEAIAAVLAAPPDARAALRERLRALGLEEAAVARRVVALYEDVLRARAAPARRGAAAA
jgi:glycosyltransferase involved in cell wall biosynthesis